MIININNKKIGDNFRTFIIAEAGVNHNGSLSKAKKLIDIAVKSGADAVKFQSFLADEIIIPKGPKSTYHKETTGSDKSLSWYNLLKSQEISYHMHKELISYSKKKKIIFLSTPYDKKSATLLFKLGVKAFKVASTDNNNFPFLEFLMKFKMPIIVSTAMCDFNEVLDIYKFFKKKKYKKFALLHCTGSYPSSLSDSNLNVIKTYKKNFDCVIGYSDHTQEINNPLVAVALGAKIIEKHYTLNKKLPGPDHRMSLEPKDLSLTIKNIREVEDAMGSKFKRTLKSEYENKKKLKKSLVINKDLKKNHKLRIDDISIKRPAYGLDPKFLNKVLGKKIIKDLKKYSFLKAEYLKK